MTSGPHYVLISRALGCRCLGVATWALLLFSSTLPVTWIPLGLCCVRYLAGFGEARFWCMCLVFFFPGSLKLIWTSGWFILVVCECNLPLHHLLHAHGDWQVETCSHRHYKRIKTSSLLCCPMCRANGVVCCQDPVLVCVVFVYVMCGVFPAVLWACWTSPLC